MRRLQASVDSRIIDAYDFPFPSWRPNFRMSSQHSQIDSQVEVVTPENIAFHYTVAGPFRRLPAFVLDLLIRLALVTGIFVVVMCLGVFTPATAGMAFAGFMIMLFLLEWFYGGILETLMNGQTPGKWVMGIRVLTIDGQPINGIQAVMRNIFRSLDMSPLLSVEVLGIPQAAYPFPTFTLALVTMALNRRYQRLGDIVAGTMVVIEERHWLTGVTKLEDPRVAQLAGYIPADFPVSRTLAQTLAAYVDRRLVFSAARRREVARHLAEPLLARFGFPADTSYDLFLCALYHRAFIADRGDDERSIPWLGESPFGPIATETEEAEQK